jgi:hypothetical protein
MGCGASTQATAIQLSPAELTTQKLHPKSVVYHAANASGVQVSHPNAHSTLLSPGTSATVSAADASFASSFNSICHLPPPSSSFPSLPPFRSSVPSSDSHVLSNLDKFPETLSKCRIFPSLLAQSAELTSEVHLAQTQTNNESSILHPSLLPSSVVVEASPPLLTSLFLSSGTTNIASYRLQRSQTRQKIIDIDLIQFDSLSVNSNDNGPKRSSSPSSTEFNDQPTNSPVVQLIKSYSSESHSAVSCSNTIHDHSPIPSLIHLRHQSISSAVVSTGPLAPSSRALPSPLNTSRAEFDFVRSNGPIKSLRTVSSSTILTDHPLVGPSPLPFPLSSTPLNTPSAPRQTSLIIGRAIPSRILAANLFRCGLKSDCLEPASDVLDSFRSRQSLLSSLSSSFIAPRINYYQYLFLPIETEYDYSNSLELIQRIRNYEEEYQIQPCWKIGLINASIIDIIKSLNQQQWPNYIQEMIRSSPLDGLIDRNGDLMTLFPSVESHLIQSSTVTRADRFFLLPADGEWIELFRSTMLKRSIPPIPVLNFSSNAVGAVSSRIVTGASLPRDGALTTRRSNRFKTQTARQLDQTTAVSLVIQDPNQPQNDIATQQSIDNPVISPADPISQLPSS